MKMLQKFALILFQYFILVGCSNELIPIMKFEGNVEELLIGDWQYKADHWIFYRNNMGFFASYKEGGHFGLGDEFSWRYMNGSIHLEFEEGSIMTKNNMGIRVISISEKRMRIILHNNKIKSEIVLKKVEE